MEDSQPNANNNIPATANARSASPVDGGETTRRWVAAEASRNAPRSRIPQSPQMGSVTIIEGLPPPPPTFTLMPSPPLPDMAADPMDTNADIRSSFVRGYFAEAPTLHALPTFYVITSACLAVSMLTAFLQTTVIPSKGHLAVFFFGAFTCFSSYYMAAHFLGEHARSFQRISPEKKMYTVSNLIKAGILAALMPLGSTALYKAMVYDDWDTNTLRNLGCIYAIPDFVSLIVVRRMSTSTYIHHVCVLIFLVISLYNDYSDKNVFRAIAVYGAFSTCGYIVYMLLATRFLGVSQAMARALSVGALLIYGGGCALNWMWQLTYLRQLYYDHHHWSIYLYAMLVSLVVHDDVNLCVWLMRRARAHTGPRQHHSSHHAVAAAAAPRAGPPPLLPVHASGVARPAVGP